MQYKADKQKIEYKLMSYPIFKINLLKVHRTELQIYVHGHITIVDKYRHDAALEIHAQKDLPTIASEQLAREIKFTKSNHYYCDMYKCEYLGEFCLIFNKIY